GEAPALGGVGAPGLGAGKLNCVSFLLALRDAAHDGDNLTLAVRPTLSVLKRPAAHFDPDEICSLSRTVPPHAELDRADPAVGGSIRKRLEIARPARDMHAIEQAFAMQTLSLDAKHLLGCGRSKQNRAVAIMTRDDAR